MPKKRVVRKAAKPDAHLEIPSEVPDAPRSPEESRVWTVIEEARQRVKPLAKREQEGQVLRGDLANLRLQALR